MLGDALSESVDLRLLSHVMWAQGCGRESRELAQASLRLVHDADTCPQLAWSLVNIAEVAAWGFYPTATEYATRALAVSTELGDYAAVLRARGAAATAQVFRTDTGWDELEQVWRQLLAIDAYGEHVGLLANVVCWAATLHRDPGRATVYIADSLAYCRDRDLLAFELFLRSVAAMLDTHRGEWARAAACAEDVLSRPGTNTLIQTLPRLVLALINARRGVQPVGALLDDIEANCDSDHQRLFGVWAARAEAAWLAGDDEAARAAAQAGLAAAAQCNGPWLLGPLRRWNYLAGATNDDADATLAPSTPYELEVSGQWQAAAQAWEQRGSPYDMAIAQLGGDIDSVQAALVTFRGLGASAAARRAQERLANMRGRPVRSRRSDTLADPDGLTHRQREVLQLLIAGRSNADIAAALYISPKTVGHHVAAVLAKLGTTSRTQVIAQALQRRSETES